MGQYADNLKRKSEMGDLSDVYEYTSYDTTGAVECGKGRVAVTGGTESLKEVEILENTPSDERFLPGAKVYVDADSAFDGSLLQLKDAEGNALGYAVRLNSKREASVEEELQMIKRRLAALEA